MLGAVWKVLDVPGDEDTEWWKVEAGRATTLVVETS
jgi:hypothetical protein